MPPKALLFDFDGVIADTENHHIAAWQRTLSALGWLVPDETAARAAVQDDREFLRQYFAEKEITDGDVEGWVNKKQSLTRLLLRDSPRLYPGVRDLVGRLQGKTRLVIVSGTWRENVIAVLETSGLARAFEMIIAKEDVAAVKPDPEAHALALRRLKLKPAQTMAVEDSPSGLVAARAAGIPCIAVGHRREFGPWVGDGVYFTGLEPVSGVLHHMGLEA